MQIQADSQDLLSALESSVIVGYSERGLVNALVNILKAKPKLFAEMIHKVKPLDKQGNDAWFSRELLDAVDSEELKILVEFDLSYFGAPDLIIRWGKENPLWFFIEAKLSSYMDAAMPNCEGMKTPGFNSSLNGQLSLRYRFVRALLSDLKDVIQEPDDLFDKIKEKESWEVRDSARHLKRSGNIELLRGLFGERARTNGEILKNIFFIALTMDKQGSPAKVDKDYRPEYFGDRQALDNTGVLAWESVRSVLDEKIKNTNLHSEFELVWKIWEPKAGALQRAISKEPYLLNKPNQQLQKCFKDWSEKNMREQASFIVRDADSKGHSVSKVGQGKVIFKVIPVGKNDYELYIRAELAPEKEEFIQIQNVRFSYLGKFSEDHEELGKLLQDFHEDIISFPASEEG